MTRPLFLLLALALPAAAEPVRDHAITVDDYATLATITELAVSPDGKHVAYCEARWDTADDSRKTDLWVVATDGKGKPTPADRRPGQRPASEVGRTTARRSTSSATASARPRRSRPTTAPPQVWRVPLDGGEPRAGHAGRGGVAEYDYAPQADALFYAVEPSATDDDDFTALRTKYKVEYGHGTRKVSEVHRLDLQTWRAEKVIAEKPLRPRVRGHARTASGSAMITAPDDTVVKSEGELARGRVGRGHEEGDRRPTRAGGRRRPRRGRGWSRWRGPRTASGWRSARSSTRYPAEVIVHDAARTERGRRSGCQRGRTESTSAGTARRSLGRTNDHLDFLARGERERGSWCATTLEAMPTAYSNAGPGTSCRIRPGPGQDGRSIVRHGEPKPTSRAASRLAARREGSTLTDLNPHDRDLEAPHGQAHHLEGPRRHRGRRRRSNCRPATRRATSCRWSSASTAGRRPPPRPT